MKLNSFQYFIFLLVSLLNSANSAVKRPSDHILDPVSMTYSPLNLPSSSFPSVFVPEVSAESFDGTIHQDDDYSDEFYSIKNKHKRSITDQNGYDIRTGLRTSNGEESEDETEEILIDKLTKNEKDEIQKNILKLFGLNHPPKITQSKFKNARLASSFMLKLYQKILQGKTRDKPKTNIEKTYEGIFKDQEAKIKMDSRKINGKENNEEEFSRALDSADVIQCFMDHCELMMTVMIVYKYVISLTLFRFSMFFLSTLLIKNTYFKVYRI